MDVRYKEVLLELLFDIFPFMESEDKIVVSSSLGFLGLYWKLFRSVAFISRKRK